MPGTIVGQIPVQDDEIGAIDTWDVSHFGKRRVNISKGEDSHGILPGQKRWMPFGRSGLDRRCSMLTIFADFLEKINGKAPPISDPFSCTMQRMR